MTKNRILGVVAVLAFGVVAPGLAAAVAALLIVGGTLVAVSLSFAGAREVETQSLDPFGPDQRAWSSSIETPDVAELIRSIETARRRVPPRILTALRTVAVGRLLDHHHLDSDDAADRPAASDLLTPQLAGIVFGDGPAEIPLTDLGALLDELERL